MKTKTDYPLCKKHGIIINPADDQSPAGCDHTSLRNAMERIGQWDRFCRDSCGWTMGMNGAYPWDVENFLHGRPNLD